MDIINVISKFEGFTLSDKAWILGTLLDFREQNLDLFEQRYGSFVKERIAELFSE